MTDYRQIYRQEIEQAGASADCFVISYPKSGRTWHRAMLGCYLAGLLGIPREQAFKLGAMTDRLGLKSVHYSHNGANFIDSLPPDDPLVACPDLWRGKPVTLLTRDPRDIVVSAYHHAVYRSALTEVNFSDFLRAPDTGIEKILTTYHRLDKNRALASDFQVIAYEDMHNDPAPALRAQLSIIGLTKIDEAMVQDVVEFCRFETMKKHEADGFYKASVLKKTSDDPRSMKVRSGQVGGYKDFMTADDLSYANQLIADMGNPFC